jgi:hypothetical protein
VNDTVPFERMSRSSDGPSRAVPNQVLQDAAGAQQEADALRAQHDEIVQDSAAREELSQAGFDLMRQLYSGAR